MKKLRITLLLLLICVLPVPGPRVSAAMPGENQAAFLTRNSFLYLPFLSPGDVGYTLVGAGDIAICDRPGAEQTALLLDRLPGATIFTAGDNAYPDGTQEDFQECFDPTWGRHKEQIRPAIGNHDYHTAGAAAYFDYFGAAAGDPKKGYYSYNLGKWHIIVLNSVCEEVSCKAGYAQERWLKADLAAHPAKCTLAYWHKPRFSTGVYGDSSMVLDFWKDLYAAGADVVINGHQHAYERYAPQDPSGNRDLTRGIREFVVGTGGGGLYDEGRPDPNTEKQIDTTYGVLKLNLLDNGYSWKFLPVEEGGPTDSGWTECH